MATTKTAHKTITKPARKTASKAPSPRTKATPKAPAKQPAAKPARARQAPVSAPTPAPALREDSKGAQVLKLLGAETGATLAAIMAATGWQAHTVRGFIAGTVRGKLNLNVISERVDGERTYRIAAA